MKAIVLAGGFAKRLWPLTQETAKPLVDVGGRPIVSYTMDKLDKSDFITEIIISTNAKFEPNFKKWLETQKFQKPVKIVVEHSQNENEKLGAVGGISYVLEKEDINGDVLVVGGDNLLGLDMDDMIRDFNKKKKTLVAAYDIKSLDEVRNKFGEIIIDDEKKMKQFREKPDNPESTLISTCCYIFPAGIRKELKTFIDSGNNKDATGFFISWLADKAHVFVYGFDNYWFDIGDHQTLEKAREFSKENLN
jgi:glucose-1-phosphate thymidylyltransferase